MAIKNRFVYLLYYTLKTPRKSFFKYFAYVKKENAISSIRLLTEVISASLKYNVSFMDYFQLRLYNKTNIEKSKYAGTGFMYEYQLQMNPPRYRDVLDNKIHFLEHFNDFSGRVWGTVDSLMKDTSLANNIIRSHPFRVVLKKSRGKAGKGTLILDTSNQTVADVVRLMKGGGFDLIEKYVFQHDDLMQLSPSALNTIRVITQLHEERVIIIAARLRVSVNSDVDNLTAGNLAAPVDVETGTVCGPGVFGDITKADVSVHPVTGVGIEGFQIPYWKDCVEMVTKAALSIPALKSVGWDVAITNEHPILIEGNHDWGRVLWQLPVKRGLKEDLMRFL